MRILYSRRSFTILLLFLAFLLPLLCSTDGAAQTSDSLVFSDILSRYQTVAHNWSTSMQAHASRLFWVLVLISMIWTFGILALRQADLSEFAAEFIRFTIFTGLFWWLLQNGPKISSDIIQSLRQMAAQASSRGQDLYPGSIVEMGFDIFFNALKQSSIWSPIDSFIGLVLSGIVLIVLALVAVNMLIMLCSAWILMYGGIFFLGFGGSRWTSELAINYYKTVLGVGVSLFAMTLLVGIGQSFVDTYYQRSVQDNSFTNLSVMVVASIILLVLVDKIPALLSGIITGASIGMGGVGNYGTGAALGTMGLAGAAAGTAGAAAVGGLASAGGSYQALKAACQAAQDNAPEVGTGPGMEPTNSLPPGSFAKAMGHNLYSGTKSVVVGAVKRRVGQTFGFNVASAIRSQSAEKKDQDKPKETSGGTLGPGNSS